MLIEILIVLFIFAVVLNTIYECKVDYNINGIKKAHLDLDVNLNKNIVKILNIIGA